MLYLIEVCPWIWIFLFWHSSFYLLSFKEINTNLFSRLSSVKQKHLNFESSSWKPICSLTSLLFLFKYKSQAIILLVSLSSGIKGVKSSLWKKILLSCCSEFMLVQLNMRWEYHELKLEVDLGRTFMGLFLEEWDYVGRLAKY